MSVPKHLVQIRVDRPNVVRTGDYSQVLEAAIGNQISEHHGSSERTRTGFLIIELSLQYKLEILNGVFRDSRVAFLPTGALGVAAEERPV